MKISVFSQIETNKRKTWLVMLFFSLFILLVSFILGKALGGGFSWIGIALILSGISTFASYYYGDKLILAISHAKEADRKKDFDLYTVTENIAIAAGLPKPKVYIIEDSAPNAFATGRDPNNAIICVTRGLLQKLGRSELEGVIAHEMSHIKNFDTRLMAIVAILVGMIAFLSDWFMRSLWWGSGRRDRDNRNNAEIFFLLLGIIFAIISPILATLIQLAISRRREFLADASAVILTRNPYALARALEIISKDKEVLEVATNATAHLYIINPFKGKDFGAWFAGLFNTHPPVEERIRILKSM